jgi:hypothetical protein
MREQIFVQRCQFLHPDIWIERTRRLFTLGFLLFAACGPSAKAANPSDIDFRLRLTGDAGTFHMGEPIGFELSYSSTSDQKYLISASSPAPDFGGNTVHLSPEQGAVDPRTFRPCWGAIGGSHLSSGPQFLSSQPITESSELTAWYRFQKPGHYTFSVSSREVLRPKDIREGGGTEIPTLESNTVEFDILPHDPAWEAGRIRDILSSNGNGSAENTFNSSMAANRLVLLDTPDAARELVALLLTSSIPEKYSYASAVLQSSQVDVMIPLLKKALGDPNVSPSSVPELLAELEVRQKLGAFVPGSDDPASWREKQAECQERRKLHDERLAQANDTLLTRVARGSGRSQSAALYEAWNEMENRSLTSDETPPTLPKLRLAVLDAVNELAPDQQIQFLITEWKILPHEQLRPLARSLSAAHHFDAERLWCEDWPSECSAAILAGVLQPNTQMTSIEVLLMPEAEHPELDASFRKELANPKIRQDSAASIRTAALVLRTGSRELLPDVDEALSLSTSGQGHNCQVQAYLLGYLFRVAVEDAQRRFGELLSDEACGDQLFRILNLYHYSDAQIPVAVEALNSRNLSAASTAAIFLAEHGPASVEEALWRRLNALWLTWHDRSGELTTVPSPFQRGIAPQSSVLEQVLVSALLHATNWTLTPVEQDRLRDGCLTEQCREIADGKMRRGL